MLAAAVLARAWETWRGTLARGVLALAVVTMLLSGVLLNVSEALGRDRRVLVTSEGIELARAIRERTPPHALFAVSMRHNDPVPVLSGRRILVGYPGWLWSQGMAYQELERALRTMLTLDKGAEREFARWGVDYVVIGPEERESFGARDEAFAARYPCVIRTANDRVYAISARAQRAERSPR
jgi:hypothetical protein